MTNFNKYLNPLSNSIHLYISILGSIVGVIVSAIFFIYSVYSSMDIVLAKFSLLLVIFFGSSLFCMLGNDQDIIANSKILKSDFIIIDKKIFKIFFCFILSFFIFYFIKRYKAIIVINLSFSELLIIHIAVLFSIFNKTMQAYCLASSKLLENAILDLFRYSGYFLFLILWILKKIDYVSLIFLIGELLVFVVIIFYLIFFIKKIKFNAKKVTFNKEYLSLGIAQFSYQSIFKLDIVTIALLSNPRLVILYSILSNVIEGIINLLNTFHPAVNNFIVKKVNKYNVKKELKNIIFIKKISSLLVILVLPAYFVFNYLVFKRFPNIELILLATLLTLAIYLFKKLFLFFYYYSMSKNPNTQLLFSLGFMIFNLTLNVILFKYLNIYGIGLATFLTYFIFYFILTKSLKKNKIF